MPFWLIALIAVAFGVIVLALLSVIVTRASAGAKREWLAENPGANVIFSSNGAGCAAFPGEKITLRGNGLLVLTPQELHFKMWAPRKNMKVPIAKIVAADIVRSFAGRLGRLPMLHIVFETEAGERLETAWALPGAANWIDEINRLGGTENGGIGIGA